MNNEMSLFGADEVLQTAGRPIVKPAQRWSDIERFDREKTFVGLFLSGHPLDPYYMELTYCCTTIKNYLDMTPEEGKIVTVGGMVTGYNQLTSKAGNMYGKIKIEDFTGSVEFPLFGQNFIEFHKFGVEGLPLVITGKFQTRRGQTAPEFSVTHIDMLDNVKAQMVNSITIDLDHEQVNKAFHDLLAEHINAYPEGRRGSLSLRIFDPHVNRRIRFNAGVRIPINRPLTEMLQDMNMEFHIS